MFRHFIFGKRAVSQPVAPFNFQMWQTYNNNSSYPDLVTREVQIWVLKCDIHRLTAEKNRLCFLNQIQERQLQYLRRCQQESIKTDPQVELKKSTIPIPKLDEDGPIDFVLC